MMTTTVQKRTMSSLLRRALEAALPPPTKKSTGSRALVDVVADRLFKALPRPHDATLTLTKTEAEREDFVRDRRSRYFNPYEQLFVFRRVATQPWDEAWRKNPLVLHDVDLVHAFHFPPYVEAEPHDQVENVTKILTNHPGPVDCLRVDASIFPPPELLGQWMDMLSLKGVRELVMLDVYSPSSSVAAPLEFPLTRLRSPALSTLSLGFVTVRFGTCFGFSELKKIFLVCCQCSARDLSESVEKLEKLTSLLICGTDLGDGGAGAGAREGNLEIVSESLTRLELIECKACALTIRHAPSVELLSAGVSSSQMKNPRVRWPRMERATTPVRIKLIQAESLEVIEGLMLSEQRVSFPGGQLFKVHTLKATLKMQVLQQWKHLFDVVAHLPVLRSLELTVSLSV
jgi:hypothetical protein